MDEETAGLFLADCEEIFDFVVRDHGFGPGELIHEERTRHLQVTFRGTALALACKYDYRDKFAGLDVIRLLDDATKKALAAEWEAREILLARKVKQAIDEGRDPREAEWDVPPERHTDGSLFQILLCRGVPYYTPAPGAKKEKKSKRRKYLALAEIDDRTLWRESFEQAAAALKRAGQDILRNEIQCFKDLENDPMNRPPRKGPPKLP